MKAKALFLLVALVGDHSMPPPPVGARHRATSSTPLAFFEFAPTSGAGMGAACACAPVTGAKGETLTFSRGSSGTCLTTAGATSPIAAGDMVTCTTDQPRAMTGNTPGLGLLVEPGRTNIAVRSQEFDNSAWSKAGFGGTAAPTVTANVAVAPDGTMTADRVQIGATGAAAYSLLSQGIGDGSAYAGSVWLEGNGQSGIAHLWMPNAGGSNACTLCSYAPNVWSRCVSLTASAAGAAFYLGVDTLDCGGGPRGAQDFFAWGGQMEAGAYASSYIATTSAAASRGSEFPTFALTWPSTTGFSMASTSDVPAATNAGGTAYGIMISDVGTAHYIWPYDATGSVLSIDATGSSSPLSIATGLSVPLSTTDRVAAFHTGALLGGCVNGTCVTTAAAWLNPTFTVMRVGRATASENTVIGGVVKQVCLDPDPTRCR